MNRQWPTLALLLLGIVQATGSMAQPLSEPRLQALLTDPLLNEISGIAPSRRNDGIHWVHGDAPRPAELLAIDEQGSVIARLRIEGVRAVDWEDIASYRKDGKAWLLIGDIGDNNGSRSGYELIAIEEPEIPQSLATMTVKPAWRLAFRYPDGAHDGEAMAVDPGASQVLLINKHAPLKIHALTLGPPRRKGEVANAIPLGELRSIPQPDASERLARFPAARFGGSPTSMDINSAGRMAVVLTYRDVWLFERMPAETWTQAFKAPRQRLPLPPLTQAEAIGFSRDADYLLIGTENLPAPLLRVDIARDAPVPMR